MARIFSPRELTADGKPSGLFHMTVHSDESDWCYPVGPCADGCPGHPTAAEAYRHYLTGEAAKIRLDGFDKDEQRKCAVCGAWTQKAAVIDGEIFKMWPLCDAHLTKEEATKLVMADADEKEAAAAAVATPPPAAPTT